MKENKEIPVEEVMKDYIQIEEVISIINLLKEYNGNQTLEEKQAYANYLLMREALGKQIVARGGIIPKVLSPAKVKQALYDSVKREIKLIELIEKIAILLTELPKNKLSRIVMQYIDEALSDEYLAKLNQSADELTS